MMTREDVKETVQGAFSDVREDIGAIATGARVASIMDAVDAYVATLVLDTGSAEGDEPKRELTLISEAPPLNITGGMDSVDYVRGIRDGTLILDGEEAGLS